MPKTNNGNPKFEDCVSCRFYKQRSRNCRICDSGEQFEEKDPEELMETFRYE